MPENTGFIQDFIHNSPHLRREHEMSRLIPYLSTKVRTEIRAKIRKNKMSEDRLIDLLGMDEQTANYCRLVVDGATEREARRITGMDKDREVMTEIESKLLVELLYREKRNIAKVTPIEVIEAYASIAFANITDVLEITEGFRKQAVKDERGNVEMVDVPYKMVQLKDFEKIPDFVLSAIKSIKQTRYGIAIEMHDKTTALGQLGANLGIFGDRGTGDQNVYIDMKGISDADFSIREEMRAMLVAQSQHTYETEDDSIIDVLK